MNFWSNCKIGWSNDRNRFVHVGAPPNWPFYIYANFRDVGPYNFMDELIIYSYHVVISLFSLHVIHVPFDSYHYVGKKKGLGWWWIIFWSSWFSLMFPQNPTIIAYDESVGRFYQWGVGISLEQLYFMAWCPILFIFLEFK